MFPFGLSLFHLTQRRTREEQLVFREPTACCGPTVRFSAHIIPCSEYRYRPSDRGLIAGLLDTFLHSVRTGCEVHLVP